MHTSSCDPCNKGGLTLKVGRQLDKRASVQVEFYSEEKISKLVENRRLPTALSDDLKGKLGQTTWYYPASSEPPRVLFVALGKEAELERQHLRKAAQRTCAALQDKKLQVAAVRVPSDPAFFKASSNSTDAQEERPIRPQDWVDELARGFLDQSYQFQKYITKEDLKKASLSEVTFQLEDVESEGEMKRAEEALRRSEAIMSAQSWARDMANERGEVANPEWYETRARLLAEQYPDRVSVETLSASRLKELGLNLIHAVGKGGRVEPRMVLVQYNGSSSSGERVALVGKGITFDTGGFNLKPTNHIEDMYVDNAGAATVLATIRACAELGIERNVVAALPFAENSVDRHAVLPSAIIRSYKGVTVEIKNTDAEGRLVLADALTYVQRHYGPSHLVDVATLTGACIVALGDCAAGIFTNSPAFAQELQQIGQAVGEVVWPLPILEKHSAELKGTDSDLKNIGGARHGGACVAAAFLKEFVEDGTKWCHLDIAGTATAHGDKQHGATGFGIQLLVEWLDKSAKNN